MSPMNREERQNRKNDNPIRVDASEGGKTKQSFQDECDINTIMGKWRSTGYTNHVVLKRPVYGDFSNAMDYMTALNAIRDADEVFASMPARVRARVNNDPAAFIAFAEDPANEEELRALGLLEPVEERAETPLAAATERGGEGERRKLRVENPPEEKKERGTAPTS